MIKASLEFLYFLDYDPKNAKSFWVLEALTVKFRSIKQISLLASYLV
jgi:hypothetical protein